MQFTLLASAFALAGYAAAATPYPFPLLQFQADDIVNKYKSVLENVTYNGQSPAVTAAQVVSPDYHEISDSINSLISKDLPLGLVQPVVTSEKAWFEGVTANPSPGIVTHNVYVAGGNNILWYWTFPHIGINKAPVSGFNLLRIDINLQIYEADIEFNSIAWGEDIFALQQYCS